MLEAKGFKAGRRLLPRVFARARRSRATRSSRRKNIPKIVGGVGPASTEAAARSTARSSTTVVPVSSTRVAEMVKLLENTFRAVNIGLVNEIALMCHKMDIDVWEVIDAAKTKPFGFMPFYPGPGLGGHCIPIDPFYLSWKARQSGFECRFIELAGQVNGSMPEYVVQRIGDALNSVEEADQRIARPPVRRGLQARRRRRARIAGARHPRAAGQARRGRELHRSVCARADQDGAHVQRSVDFESAIGERFDCAVIATDHTAFDYGRIAQMPLVVDTRNALKKGNRSVFSL